MIAALIVATVVSSAPSFNWEIVLTDLDTKETKTYRTNERFVFFAGRWQCEALPEAPRATDLSTSQRMGFTCTLFVAGQDNVATAQIYVPSGLCAQQNPGTGPLVDTYDVLNGRGMFRPQQIDAGKTVRSFEILSKCLK